MLRDKNIAIFNFIEQNEELEGQEDGLESEEGDDGKFLMLRDTNIAIFNFIVQSEELESPEDGQSKFLMLRDTNIAIFSFIVQSKELKSPVKPPTPWSKKLRSSMLMCLIVNCY